MSIPALAQQTPQFTTGNLVVVVEGCGAYGGTCNAVVNGTGNGSGNSSVGGYGDNQAAPLSLFQFAPVGTTSASYVNSLALPQAGSGANFPVSSEYGSSSEGTLHLSGFGPISHTSWDTASTPIRSTPIPFFTVPFPRKPWRSPAASQAKATRRAAGRDVDRCQRQRQLVDGTLQRLQSPTIYAAPTPLNGTTVYVSGQGSGSDATGGVFFTPLGATNTAPTPITGLDTTSNTLSQDTRDVQINNDSLYVSVDSKEGSGSARSFIARLGSAGAPPTTTVGAPVMLTGFGNSGGTGKVSITTGANSNGNNLNAGLQINLSPVNYFFANASTLYVADGGNPKNNSATSSLGNGGLQKWINRSSDGSGTWSLAYTLHQGLSLVANSSASGTTGLYGLTGTVSGGTVQLYATNATILDLDPTYLYGISDNAELNLCITGRQRDLFPARHCSCRLQLQGSIVCTHGASPATPVITWPAPAAITFGSALSASQLNATANVPGTFVYNPPAGTVLQAGAGQTLSVAFTPNDTTDYTSATASTTITVNPAAATPANLVVTKVLTRSAGVVMVQLTISNTGQTAASNVVLTGVKVGSDSATPLPQVIGTVPAGTSVQATVSVPGSVGASGAASSLTLSGTYTGGTFSSSARITLP